MDYFRNIRKKIRLKYFILFLKFKFWAACVKIDTLIQNVFEA